MSKSGTRAPGIELPIALDRGRGSIRRQLEDALRAAIRDGTLSGGTALPSSRVLAGDLSVSRRLVVETYAQLTAEGYLVTAPRARTCVSELAAAPAATAPRATANAPLYDLRPGTPDLGGFPRGAWRRAHAAILRDAPDDVLRYPDPRGAPELRAAVAEYLRRVRAVVCDGDRVVICSGVREAISILAGVLADAIGVEDPGPHERGEILTAAGSRPHALPVDGRGLCTDGLVDASLAAVLVTPAHQFPTGVALAAERRGELTAWASHGRLVIEDDYDAEFRYDRTPLSALQGLAPEHVAYVGSVSKTLSPALRLGWLVLPAWLVEPCVEAKRLRDGGTPTLPQLALGHLISSGEYDRHLRRARRRYRARRDALLRAIRRHLPAAQVTGMSAGLHVLVTLPSDVDMRALDDGAGRRRLTIASVGQFRLAPRTDDRALVIGYATLSDADHAMRLLAEAVADATG